MTETPPPSDQPDPHRALIDSGDGLTRWYIEEITALLAPEPGKVFGAGLLRWILRHFLLPAEAVLRRTVHLIAATLPPLVAVKPASRTSAHPRTGGRLARQIRNPRTPLFRLTEPQPRPRTNYLPVGQRPRISVPGITPPVPAKSASAQDRAEALEARLRRRLAAITAAWDDPDKAALRLQRLRARGKIRHPALAFFKIPGARASTLNDVAAPILRDLNSAAFDAAAASRLAAADTS